MENSKLFVKVILPLKLSSEIYYFVEDALAKNIVLGCWVKVNFSNREYLAVVSDISDSANGYLGRVKSVISVEPIPPVIAKEFELWNWMTEYYMCQIGEVFRAAYPAAIKKIPSEKKRAKKEITIKSKALPKLSEAQIRTLESVKSSFELKKPSLLQGVTGSGKTEIYLHLAKEYLDKGKSVLYMLPEIALSRQLSKRIEQYFGENLLIFHSKQTQGERFKIHQSLGLGDKPYFVLGLRSSVFLPFSNTGLVIIDEEHDSSYKQADPAPRYNGRDCALILASLHSADVLLGSATPSLESLYNAFTDKFKLTTLNERFFGSQTPQVEIVDTILESKKKRMNGLFSQSTLDNIRERIESGEQVIIFKNRRSYSPSVQCSFCGTIPNCKSCNVPLNYHKTDNQLTCHYCGHRERYTPLCMSCGKPGLIDKGAGTEKIEELIKELFPNARVERFDADTTKSKANEKRILKDFAQHKTDILVGTQMLSKGFHFEHLTLVCIIQADSLLTVQDFRANERAVQMLAQLAGRAGRELKRGKIIIQTAQAKHPVFRSFFYNEDTTDNQLQERKEFDYPPYVRLIKMTIRDTDHNRLDSLGDRLHKELSLCPLRSFTGPFTPALDKLRGEFQMQFWIKLDRDSRIKYIKQKIAQVVSIVSKEYKNSTIVIDVDPL